MIVVMPDGWSRYGCSQWVDAPTNGNFEQYVVHEIVPYIDAHYRTIPDAASRLANTGSRISSMGGNRNTHTGLGRVQ